MNSETLQAIISRLEAFAPLGLAEDWDNVGLLIGDRQSPISTIKTCLTITPEVVAEAITSSTDLLVTHHPLPFHPLKKITSDSATGRMLLDMIRNGIAVFSPHTAFDSTAQGINQMTAQKLGLVDIQPIKEIPGWTDPDSPAQVQTEQQIQSATFGVGRSGRISQSCSSHELCQKLIELFELPAVKFCGTKENSISRVGIACGSAGQFLTDAHRAGCDAFITGEASFHTCLEARALGISLFLLGHYPSERFAVEFLAQSLGESFPQLSISASSSDLNPVDFIFPVNSDS